MNTRFAVAVHILAVLHTHAGEATSSEFIAGSVNTNPTLIRRLLSQLAKAGLTTSRMGISGGALLKRPAHTITLRDVYQAMEENSGILAIHEHPNPTCIVGRRIGQTLRNRVSAAEQAFEAELQKTTIAQMTDDILALEKLRPPA